MLIQRSYKDLGYLPSPVIRVQSNLMIVNGYGHWTVYFVFLSVFLGRYQSSPPCWRIQNSHLCRLTNDMVARNRRSWHRQKRFGKLSSCSSHTCPLQKVAYKTLHDLASANNGLWACICPSRSCSCNIWSWIR